MENKTGKPYSLQDAESEIAIKHGLGTTLVTGHKALYWREAAELYASKATEELRKELEDMEIQVSMYQTDRDERKQLVEELRKENEELKEYNTEMSAFNKYLTEMADRQWREQYNVEDGEDFIHWYLRYIASEIRSDAKHIERLKESNKELVEALKYSVRFHKKEDVDIDYIMQVLQKHEGEIKK